MPDIKVTTTGTSIATSLVSFLFTLAISTETSYQHALSSADNAANIINQTITIINENNKESITTTSLTSDSITTDSITTTGNINLSTLFTTPILGQLGYINNVASFTPKTFSKKETVILSQIKLTPGVWQVFYKFKYYSPNAQYAGPIFNYIYGLTTSSILSDDNNYNGFLSNQYSYSNGETGYWIEKSPFFVSNKESLAVSITQDTTYYLQFGLNCSTVASGNLKATCMELYAVRIA